MARLIFVVLALFAWPALADDFNAASKDFLNAYFKTYPIAATQAGDHRYDHQLPDTSPAGRRANVAMLTKFKARFADLDPARLSPREAEDRQIALNNIEAALLAETTLQTWRRDPDRAMTTVIGALFVLIARDFAPAEQRLASATARLRATPGFLRQAARDLDDPAPVLVDIALNQIDGNAAFIAGDLTQAFAGVKDAKLQAAFARAKAQARAAIETYKAHLTKIRPKAKGQFAIGKDAFAARLRNEDMVDLPLDRLLEVAFAQLRKDQADLAATADTIAPGKPLEEVLAQVQAEHVAPDQLLSAAKGQLDDLRKFLIEHEIVTMTWPDKPDVTETPPFMRATTFASMDTPGPLEAPGLRALYNVTLPDPRWDKAKTEEFMRGYNTPLLLNVSVHEVWPGHYMQYVADRSTKDLSMIRRVFGTYTTTEGWAHYTEQMMVEEGLSGHDPKLKLMQLIDALLRDCRFIVGISLHTKGMTIDEAKAFFIKEGHQVTTSAEGETYRGTQDPTYLAYTVGKLAILKLREDYKAKMGQSFKLKDFHDRFLAEGLAPLPMIRRALMGQDGPLL